jgi:hypothetical protein
MLASISSILRLSFALLKLRSQLLTALNWLPSMATTASENMSSCWHSTMNWRRTLRIALPLSLRACFVELSPYKLRTRACFLLVHIIPELFLWLAFIYSARTVSNNAYLALIFRKGQKLDFFNDGYGAFITPFLRRTS